MVRIPLASVAALSLLVACGGGGEGSGGTSSPPANAAPSAQAGATQTVGKSSLIALDGTASSDPETATLAYRWTQTAGTPVILSSSTASKPTFTSPSATGSLTFSL